MKSSLRIVLTMAMLTMLGNLRGYAQPPSDEAQIRKARAESNAAIARKDTHALAAFWTEDYHLVSSRNIEVSGREANLRSFGTEFGTKKDVLYVRTPTLVQVNADWNMASENGTWTGQWQEPDGMVRLEGIYFAKWHKTTEGWKIRAEIFVPQRCSGSSFCQLKPAL
jgi:ketosteroid isomerase-like protein